MSSSNMQRINKANQLRSQLQKTTNLEDRIKLHQAAIKMIDGRENEDPDDNDSTTNVQRNNEFGGIQAIPLLSTNSRGQTLSSFEPSTTEGGVTSSTSNESLHRNRRGRRHSVSSESSTSSAGRSRKSATRNSSLSHIPAVSRERLTPDAEKRVFNYNYRGPIPTKHHCQRSLFGKTVDVTPEPAETPKRRIESKNRTPLRHQPCERPNYDHRPGMHLHESSCDAARRVQASKSSSNVSMKNPDYKKTPPRFNKGSLENLFQSSAKKRLDAWQPLERSKSSNNFKPISSTSFNRKTDEDSDGYAIPSVSEPDRTLLKTPVRREITPPELYKTPALHLNQEGSENDSFESAKEFQTPFKENLLQSGKNRVISKETLQDETAAELAAIDTVLAKVSPARTRIPTIKSRTINLTPATDYRNLKDTSVEKNFEEVQAAIKLKKDKTESSDVFLQSNDTNIEDNTITPKAPSKESQIFVSPPKSKIQTPPNMETTITSFSQLKIGSNHAPKSSFKSPHKSTLKNEPAKRSFTLTSNKKTKDVQTSHLFPKNCFDTPKTSKSKDNIFNEMTPNTKFRTSLSRDRLIQSFKEALDINTTAKKRFLKHERQFFEQIRDLKRVDRIDKELEKFPERSKKAMEDVKSATLDYSEKIWRHVLAQTERLQNDAKEFVKLTNERKEKRRRRSLSFGPLGEIDANEFERKHFESLSRRHENALRLSEVVKKVNVERAIVELQERRVIKDLVRLSLDNKMIAGISASTESSFTRRSVTLTSTEIRKLAEDAKNNTRKLGKAGSKPDLHFVEQESSDGPSERKSQSSAGGIILSSRHHARIIETHITEKLFVSDNFMRIPQSGIPSAASSVVPRLDFSVLEDSASNKLKTEEPVANFEENDVQVIDDIVIPDVDTEIISKKQSSKESSSKTTERSDGRTSRDVSSISEFEPPPAELEISSNDEKKTENDVSSIHEIEESVHDDSTLTQESTTNHAEPKPIEHLHTPSEASIFSALPSTHSHDDLQSLPDPLSEKSHQTEPEKKEETNELHVVEEHQNHADSDPERLPLSATTAGTFNASPISSSRLLGDSPIPSPPFVAPSLPGEISKADAVGRPASEQLESIAEVSDLHSVHSSKSSTSTESSKVVVPLSLENSDHEKQKPSASVVNEEDEKSTTSISTAVESSTTSVASTISKTTSSKSSSTSTETSKVVVPSSLESSEKSFSEDPESITDASNLESVYSSSKSSSTAVENNKAPFSSSLDNSINETSGISNTEQPKPSRNRRKSWDMVETGIIGKQSPSYLKNDTVDNDVSAIFNNDAPKFESAPSPLGPYAAVSPRSPRSGEHSRRHSLSRSPPLAKPSHSKFSVESFDNNFLLDDVSLSNIAAPIFDISINSERGSLGFKDDKNIFEWSPGLSKELPQPKIVKKTESIEKEEEEAESATVTESTSISTGIDESPLDQSVKGVKKEIEKFCLGMWPQVESAMETENIDLIVAPRIDSNDPEQHYHDSYKHLLAESLFLEVQSKLQKGLKFSSFEMFKKQMIDGLLNKLSIERKNDLLDGRHVWIQKNPAFMKLVQSRSDAQDYDSELVNDYKRELVCKAIAAENIIKYSNERANRFTDIGFQECIEFLQKHAPEQLEAVLSQYDN